MLYSEVNSAGYSEIGEPIILRKKHHPPARYIINKVILSFENVK